MRKRVSMLIILSTVLTGCNWIQEIPVMNYQKKEVEEIDANTRTVLDALGYSGYQVFVFPHGSYHSPVLSQKKGSELFAGDVLYPEAPPDDNMNVPPGLSEKLNGKQGMGDDTNIPPGLYDKLYGKQGKESTSYSKDETIANFSDSGGIGYNLDYVSVLLVFDKLAPGEEDAIRKLLKNTVLNSQRGDNAVIYYKKTPAK